MKSWQAGLASSLLGLAIWQTVVWVGDLPKFILPGPGLVAETLWKSRVLIAENALVTLSEVLVGLVLGAILGGLSAIGLAASSMARVLVRSMLVFSQTRWKPMCAGVVRCVKKSWMYRLTFA